MDTEIFKDELLNSIIEACEQTENDWRSENILFGLRYRSEDRISELYNRAYYGYKKDTNGMLIIDQEEVRVFRRIYDLYLEGYSIGGIIDKLEEKKIIISKGKER
ncbi:recombinase family protein [Granulicatella adiacens]|uniref:recombinase family protein n=1 Tax=Granulicatella adiacens TaxID=46124 RepID=UPI0020CBC565|nr:recombinase family protein [Granulicatella adiacens]